MALNQSRNINNLAFSLQRINNYAIFEAILPALFPIRYTVNFFKGATFLWVIILIYYFNNYTSSMFIYLGLHGSYGIFWIIKDYYFPDAKCLKKGSLLCHISLVFILISYWIIPLPLAAGYVIFNPSIKMIILMFTMYGTGIFLMMGSDYQKYKRLKIKPGLISDGFFKLTRNPNYLGQLLIYTSFALCSANIIGFIIVYILGGTIFTINIFIKEYCSFQLKDGWQQYQKQSYIFLPKIFSSNIINFAFYTIIIIVSAHIFNQEAPSNFLYPFSLIINGL